MGLLTWAVYSISDYFKVADYLAVAVGLTNTIYYAICIHISTLGE